MLRGWTLEGWGRLWGKGKDGSSHPQSRDFGFAFCTWPILSVVMISCPLVRCPSDGLGCRLDARAQGYPQGQPLPIVDALYVIPVHQTSADFLGVLPRVRQDS